MRRRPLAVSAVCVAIAAGCWLGINPGQRFGLSSDSLTTYDRLPLPFVDLQVRGDATMRLVSKSHRVGAAQLAWLIAPEPEVLIIATGWQGDVKTDPFEAPGLTKVLTLKTSEALKMFNSLRQQGVRVAIHVHSTC